MTKTRIIRRAANYRWSMDIGGNHARRSSHYVNRQDINLHDRQTIELKFHHVDELIEHCFEALRRLPGSQNAVVVSIAGPVDTKRGIIRKLTNHTDVEFTDIPFSELLSAKLERELGRPIKVIVINDGVAGGWAEMSPMGALKDMPVGSLGMALIIGNGVGGRLFRKTKSGLEPVVGGFEPGHFPMSPGALARFVPPDLKCGCQARPTPEQVCFELMAKGPGIEVIARNYLAAAFNTFLASGVKFSLPGGKVYQGGHYSGPEVAYQDPLVRRIVETHHLNAARKNTRTLRLVVDLLTNADVTDTLNNFQGGRSIASAILGLEAGLLVQRLEALQRGYDDQGPLHIALIGSLGHYWGPHLVPVMEGLSADYPKPTWGQTPVYRVGAFHPEETNLWGDLFYLQRYEQARALRSFVL